MSNHVLIVGVELTDRPSLARSITYEFSQSQLWEVSQLWAREQQPYTPKFVRLNQVLKEVPLDEYEYVIVCDDDIALPTRFLDRYLRIVSMCRFVLAQPARTPESEIHHPIVRQMNGRLARETRFVEIGPLFSMHKSILPLMLPFDEMSPMGWGYDYAWPVVLESFRMGIVDATPVLHAFRPALSGYSGASEQMAGYLQTHSHLSPEEAYTTRMEYLG